jgi:hypothetical protein
MSRAWSRRQEEALGQQNELRSATHLALEHLQAIDVPFDGALTPGQRHPSLDAGIVLTQSFGKALEGREGARGGARQPRIELGRLALADTGGEVPRECHRLCQCGVCSELRQLVVPLICGLVWRTENQPGRPAGGELASWGVSHRRQRPSAAPLPRGQPLGLAHAPDLEGDKAILAPQPLATDHTKEMRAIPTPAVPPGQEDGLVRIEATAVAAMPRLALRKRRALEIALHGAPAEPDLVRHRIQGPALPMGAPDLLIAGHPRGPPRRGKGHRPCGRRRGRERHGGNTGG